jgi:hypothetical protein
MDAENVIPCTPNATGVQYSYSDGRIEYRTPDSNPVTSDEFVVPVLARNTTRNMDARTDARVDAITRRFSWFANPDEQWPNSLPTATYHQPNQYHLRRKPQIQCPACLNGELGQLSHMQGPHGCLFSEEGVENE